MDYLETLHTQKKATTYSWQQKALDMWVKLGLSGKPTSSFFKCFKKNEKKAESVAYSISDGDFDDPVTYFYKVFYDGNNSS